MESIEFPTITGGYKPIKFLGKGSFGQVYLYEKGSQKYAVKVETQGMLFCNFLLQESLMLRDLTEADFPHIPKYL